MAHAWPLWPLLADDFKVVDKPTDDIGSGVAVKVDDSVEEIVRLCRGSGDGAVDEKCRG